MRVDRIRFVRVPLSLAAPLRTATGTHHARTATLVEITLDDGTVGWGENVAPEGDFYTGETAAASYEAMRDVLAPLLGGREVEVADLFDQWWGIAGWQMAKHALESALWDAHSRRLGRPLADVLGGSVRTVRVGAVVGVGDSVAATVEECQRRVAEGYGRIKVKIAPGRDVDAVRAVRSAIGPGVELDVDANGSYGPHDVGRLAEMCAEGVGLIEQPFAREDLASHADLAARTAALVGLDESVASLAEVRRAIDAGACGAINVKPAKSGGLGEALAVLDTCRHHGVPAWVGGMLESAIGRASALALATHPACTLAPDLSASTRYFDHDVAEPFDLEAGRLRVPGGPGLGRVPSPEVLAHPATAIDTVYER